MAPVTSDATVAKSDLEAPALPARPEATATQEAAPTSERAEAPPPPAAAEFRDGRRGPPAESDSPAVGSVSAPAQADNATRRADATPSLEEARAAAPQEADQLARLDAAAKAAPAPAEAQAAGATAAQEAAPPAARAAPLAQQRANQPPAGAPPAAPAASAPTAGFAGATVRQEVAAVAPWRAEAVSPDGPFRWRVGMSGAAQASPDRGATWQGTATGVTADLLAASSPGGTICWIVGRAGTVLLTIDGRRWQRLPFPVTTDVTAVQATDARRATVTAQDGRRFSTTDGGATWN
jgi:hypothetical protein